jgi:hypothetical protein
MIKKTILTFSLIILSITAIFGIPNVQAQTKYSQLELYQSDQNSSTKEEESREILRDSKELPSVCNGSCPIIKDPTFESLPEDTKLNSNYYILSVFRTITFVLITISVIFTPISLIVTVILFLTKSKHSKKSLIATVVLASMFVITIILYTITGLFVGGLNQIIT